MPKEREPQLPDSSSREPFVTIDDLVTKADELAKGLKTLSKHKHPLDVRRGKKNGEGVIEMAENSDSRTVRAGAKTYFLDLKETKQGKPFLVITESRFKKEGEERERTSVTVFQDQAEEFGQAVAEMISKLL